MGLKIATAIGAFGLAAVLAGCSGGGDSNASSGSGSGSQAASGAAGGSGGGSGMSMSGGGAGGGSGGAGKMAGMMGGGSMGGGMMGGGQAAPAAAVAKNPGGAMPSHRPDPFKPWWSPPPPPSVLTFTSPVRIAMADTSAPKYQPNIEVHEVPTRRVAGILSGNGVYALIEGNGEMTVVKPGDPVGDYRVDSINSDSVVLKKVVTFGKNKQTYTQVVPLTDVGSSVAQFSGPVGGAGRLPGMGRGPGLIGPGGRPGGGKGGGVGGLD